MIVNRWPDLPVLGSADLPPLLDQDGEINQTMWPGLFLLAEHLPAEHAVIGGIMVYLHGAVAGRHPARVTSDVDVLFDVEVLPSSLQDAVAVLGRLGYRVHPASPPQSTHRYLGPRGEEVDVLAPYGVKPPPNLITTPPGRTIEVFGGRQALRNRVVVYASYSDQAAALVVPDLARALGIKAAAFGVELDKSPAKAHYSRHLEDLAFLASLIPDPHQLREDLGPVPSGGHLSQAAPLDSAAHHAWAAAGEHAEDAHLMWEIVRDTATP